MALALWIAARGGWLLAPFGGMLAMVALGWAFVALRRLRFAAATAAPGLVEVVEGQVAYFGPDEGGFIALGDLVEIAIEPPTAGRGAAWRLIPAEGAALCVPVAAEGAERLYDAFARLPGIDMGRIAAAPAGRARGRLWRHPARVALVWDRDATP